MNVRRKLANALLALCNQKPLEYITVTEIAQKADLTRQVFYKYFVDKYELANWIQIDDYFSILQQNDITGMDWTTYVEGWLSLVEEHQNFYQNMYYSAEKEFQRLFKMRIIDFYAEIIRIHLKKDLNYELSFSLDVYCSGGCEKISEWILSGMKISAKEMCHLLACSMPSNIKELLVDKPFPTEIMEEIRKFRIENVMKI